MQKPQNAVDNTQKMEATISELENDIEMTFLQYSSNKNIGLIDPEFDKLVKFLRRTQKKVLRLNDLQVKLSKEIDGYSLMNEKTEKTLEKEQLSLKELEEQIATDKQALDESQKRVQELRDKTKQLKKENGELVNAIKEGVQLSPEQQDQLQELMDYKAKLTYDLDDEIKRIVLLRTSVIDVSEKLKIAEQDGKNLEVEIAELQEKDHLKKIDIERETRQRDFLDKELKQLRASVTSKQQDAKTKEDNISKLSEENSLLEIHVNNQIQLIQQFSKEKESTLQRIQKLAEESKEQSTNSSKLEEENLMMEREVKEKMIFYANQKSELKRNTKIKEEIMKRVNQLEITKAECEEEKRILKDEIDSLSEELEITKRIFENHKKSLDDLTREKNWIKSLAQKSTSNTKRTGEILAVLQQMKNNQDIELVQQERSIASYDEKIKTVASERESLIKNSIELQKQYLSAIRDLKINEEQIFDYRKKMTEVERKLKHQQALYEAVQNDRNIYSKHLLDNQNDIHQMKRKLKTMYYQINNYKEEIKSKAVNLQRCINENQKLNDDIDQINKEIEKLKHQNELSQIYIRKQAQEEGKLIQFVKSSDLERTKQEHSLKVLIGERDNLSTQVIKQNSELTKVYDQLRVLHSQMRHTDAAYLDVSKELGTVRKRVADIRKLRSIYKAETSEYKSIYHLKTQLDYELMIETMKLNTIQRESILPLNIHRWRQLESTNPKLFEMIQLLQGLQRRLLLKREEEDRKEKEIEETEKLFLQLKAIQAAQMSNAEAESQLSEFKMIFKEKSQLLKNLSMQLHMFKAQIRENEYLKKHTEREIGLLKSKYIKSRIGGDRSSNSVSKIEELPPLPVKN